MTKYDEIPEGYLRPSGNLNFRVTREAADAIAELSRMEDEYQQLLVEEQSRKSGVRYPMAQGAGAGYFTQDQQGKIYPVVSDWPIGELWFREVLYHAGPRHDLPEHINAWRIQNLPRVLRAFGKILFHRATPRKLRLPAMYGALWLTVLRAEGPVEEYGLASLNLVTTAGVNALVDAWQGTFTLNNFKFHGIGTGTNAEATGDTALQTEITTAYSTDNTRATGTTIDGASANIIRSVATNTVDAAVANTEHGILSQAATGGGTLWDRSVYSVLNLASGDSLQSTYDGTFPAGG